MESPPLARFLQALGKAQHHLHTAVVGLSAVEGGTATKPTDLDITWNPHDPIGSAREARRFLMRATLIFVAEELNQYAKGVHKVRALTTGNASLPQDRASRIRALAEPHEVDPAYLTVAPLIVVHWRNRIVHRDSNARLVSAEQDRVLQKGELIRELYKGVDVARLLQDFESDRPTLKDVTVLLAMSIRFVRQVDSHLPHASNSQQVRLWLQAEDLLADVVRIEKEAANGGHPDPRQRVKQFLLTKAPVLADPYYLYGSNPAI